MSWENREPLKQFEFTGSMKDQIEVSYYRFVKFAAGSAFFATTSLALFVSAAALKLSGKELAPELATAGGYILIPALLCVLLAAYFNYQAKHALGPGQEALDMAEGHINELRGKKGPEINLDQGQIIQSSV